MPTFELERLGRKFETREEVFAFQIRKFLQEIIDGIASGEVFEHRFDRIAQVSDNRLSMADFGIDGDARQQRAHGAKGG